MAYAYQQNMSGGSGEGYVKFNVGPAFSHSLAIGEAITISGQVYWRDYAVKCVQVFLVHNGSTYIDFGYVNTNIAKKTSGTFSITATVTQHILDFLDTDNYELIYNNEEPYRVTLEFSAWTGADQGGWEGHTFCSASHYFYFIHQRSAPVINSVNLSDRYGAIKNNQTPFEYFGGYVQNESLPCITVAFATDSNAVDLTATHELEITSEGVTVYSLSLSTAALASSAVFDLSVPIVAGSMDYTYRITDSAGQFATYTGTFLVYPYVAPSISLFDLQRYKHNIEQGNIAADDGTYLWMTFEGAVRAINSLNEWSLVLEYGVVDGSNINSQSVVTATDGTTIVYTNSTLLYDTYGLVFSAANAWECTIVLTDLFHSEQRIVSISKAGAYFNVEKNGVAVGQRSTGTANDKRFEVAADYESHFYGGIHADGGIYADGGIEGVTNYASGEVDTGGTWVDGKPIYRYTAVFNASIGSSATNIHTIPSGHDKIIRLSLLMDNIRPVPYWATSSYWASIYINGNNIRAQAGSSEQKSHSFVLVMEYTRT